MYSYFDTNNSKIISFYGRNTHQLINISKINQSQYKKYSEKATEISFKYVICYTGADTQNILLTSFEEYHPRQFSMVDYYCLQSLYLHTEETPISQGRIYIIDSAVKKFPD
jgi:hypothetical protein